MSAAAPRAAPAPAALAAQPSPLFAAIEAKDAAALRQALAQGAPSNARQADGNPALHQAVIQRWADGVRLLMAAGADAQLKNNQGQSAFDLALNDEEMLKLLAR
ncbi:MAG: hypothetical protein HC765_15410 [Brachymonas sp.]|nr:hypothetical protein [Brachymonas sp.]